MLLEQGRLWYDQQMYKLCVEGIRPYDRQMYMSISRCPLMLIAAICFQVTNTCQGRARITIIIRVGRAVTGVNEPTTSSRAKMVVASLAQQISRVHIHIKVQVPFARGPNTRHQIQVCQRGMPTNSPRATSRRAARCFVVLATLIVCRYTLRHGVVWEEGDF